MIELAQRMMAEQEIPLLIDILNYRSRRFFKIHKRSRKVRTAFEIKKEKEQKTIHIEGTRRLVTDRLKCSSLYCLLRVERKIEE